MLGDISMVLLAEHYRRMVHIEGFISPFVVLGIVLKELTS